jgi:membrane-associated protein
MGEFFQQVWDLLCTIVANFKNPEAWPDALKGAYWPTVVVVAVIVFAETGLLVGFFLPGDSLLVTLGIVAYAAQWDVVTMMAVLMAAAVVGDTVGYWFGAKTGPRLFNRPNSRWFKRDHLLAAKAFFDRHGGKTIIIARFMPFARTFVPVVAGAAKMNYRWFFAYNVIGGVAWIGSMLLFGYFAVPVLDEPLKKVFGDDFSLAKKIDILAGVIIVLSVLPMVVHYLIERRRKKRLAAQAAAEPVAVGAGGQPPTPTA